MRVMRECRGVMHTVSGCRDGDQVLTTLLLRVQAPFERQQGKQHTPLWRANSTGQRGASLEDPHGETQI